MKWATMELKLLSGKGVNSRNRVVRMETEGNGLACSVYFLCCVVLFILSFPVAGLVSLLPPKRAFVVFGVLLCLGAPFAVCAVLLGLALLLGADGPVEPLPLLCLAASFFLPFAAGMGFAVSKARYPEE